MHIIGIQIDLLMIPFKEIPTDFVVSTLTDYQKEAIEIKYIIKLAMEEWEGNKYALYEKLTEELHLSFHRIRKIAEQL